MSDFLSPTALSDPTIPLAGWVPRCPCLAGNFLWFRELALDVVPVQPSVGAQRVRLGEPLVALPLLGAIGQVPPLAFGSGFGTEGLVI
jgi:hypothetical protein